MPFNPFSALTSKIFGAVAIAALAGATIQTVRVADRDTTIAAQKVAIARRTAERDLANASHRQTKLNFRHAQDQAQARERARLARVASEQQEITDEIVADYRRRLAGARAAYERLRDERAGYGARARGPADGQRLPPPGNAADRADRAAEDPGFSLEERRIATEQAIQLNALISWVAAQLRVEVN